MKYFIKVILYTIICTVMFSACTSVNKPEDGQQGTEAAGGDSLIAENINLKDISVLQKQGETFVTFSFLSGSRKTGYAEKKLTQMPKYEIKLLDQPARLRIKFHNISFWDYESADNKTYPDYIAGIFREVPAKDNSLVIYIQFTKNITFTPPEEEEGSLTISIAPSDMNNDVKYYCVANAFLEHQEGRWPDTIDMQPVLCADLSNKLLVSRPFDNKEDAYAYAQNALSLLEKTLPEKTLNVVALSGGALPEYMDIDYLLLEKRSIIQKDGSTANTPLLINNGRYLCSAADGRIAFARIHYPDGETTLNNSYVLSETLWIRHQNDRIQSIDVPDFFSIKKAAFSSDGRYLGILDVSAETSVLYVYDFDAQKLYNIGEEGFGSLTADFAWSDIENTVYAYSNTKIMSCSFSGEIKTISEAGEWPAGEGSLEISKGRIFFAHNGTRVYQLGVEKTELTKGADIKISPDGNKLLVLEKETSENEQVLTSLKLYDIETREETAIVRNADIACFGFSQSGGKIYYTADSNESEQFRYALYVYDTLSGTLTKAALCSTAIFFPAASPADLYFVDYIDESQVNGFFATYIYDIEE